VKKIYRTVEAVAVRDIRAITPALVTELFDGKEKQFLIDPLGAKQDKLLFR